MELLVVVWIICAFGCAILASAKRRSTIGWFLLGLIFGIFALIVAAGLPSRVQAGVPSTTRKPQVTDSIAVRVVLVILFLLIIFYMSGARNIFHSH